MPESELVYSDAEESKQVEYIVNRLVEARLLVKGQEAGAVYVEPAHDFLVRGWDQLQKWIKNKQDNLALQQRLTVAANDWHSKSQQEKEQKTLLNILRQAETFVICKVQDWQLDREHRKQRDVEPSKRSREKSIQYLWDDDPRLEQLKRILIKKNWFNRDEDVFVRESLIERQRNSSRLIAIITTVGLGLIGLTIAALYQAQLSSLREKAAVARNRFSTATPLAGLVLAIDATGQNGFWLPWNMLNPVQSSLLVALEEARESNSFTIEGQDFIETAAFSPDGKYIATGNGFTASGTPPPGMTPMKANGTIWLRDLQGNPISKPMPHKGRVDYIAFSSDGKYIASRDLEEKFVKIWNLQGNLIKKESAFNITNSGKQNIFIIYKNVLFLQGNSTYGDIQALSSDSKYTAGAQSLSNVIIITDNLTQENTNEPKILTNLRGCESPIKAIRFSENNTHVIAVCNDRKIKVWELQDSSVISIKINKPEQYTGGFTFDKNSQNLITGNADGIIKIWDLYGKERKYFKTLQSSISSIAVSQNGQYILIDGSSLQLWDTNGNQIHKHFKADGHTIESVAFSAENKYIISGGYDGTVRLWNLEGENLKTFELAKGSFHRKEEVWSVKSIAFTSDSKYIVAGISTDEFNIGGYVQLLDINGNPQGQPFGNTWQFALNPNGKYIAVGDANNTIQLWDMKGNRVSPLFRGHENWINSLAFSPDGRFIASASFNTLKLWDTQGNLISTFQVHQVNTNSLMFSPDGQYIAGSSVDGTVKLWPSNWKTALKVACNRLKHHPVLTAPKTDEEKSAARTCLSYRRMER
ncbi:WD40 repeat domain-containing protein [Nostoc sp. CHAB 5834]|nr:WD40 repeat domain-containing protein [Nostoc sp. CHAB 5834]